MIDQAVYHDRMHWTMSFTARFNLYGRRSNRAEEQGTHFKGFLFKIYGSIKGGGT